MSYHVEESLMRSSRFERFLQFEIDTINDHLPKASKSLSAVLQSEDYRYICKDGSTSAMRLEELKKIASVIPIGEHKNVKVPIVILRRRDLGKGAYTVGGTLQNLFVIKKIIGIVEADWYSFKDSSPSFTIYRPMIQEIRRELPTTTAIGLV